MTLEATEPVLAPPAPVGPAPGRTRRAVMTWAAGAIYSLTTILVGFVTTPILLRMLGPDRIGAHRAVGEWLGYLMLADLGLASAFGVLLVRARRTSLDQTAAVARFALRAMSAIMLLIAPAGLLLAWFMPRLVRIDPVLVNELRRAAVVGALGLLFVPLGVFRSVLETGQRGYRVNAALMAQSLVITGLSLLLAWIGWGLIGLAVATVAGAFVFTAMTLWWGVRHFGPSWRIASTARIPLRELWSLSWPLAAAGAGNRLNLMTDAVVVGYFLDSSHVAVLFLTQRVILLCAAQVNALGNATWAALAELLAHGRIDVVESRLAEITRLIVGGGTVLVGTVAAYDAHFVRLWVGSSMYGGDLLAALTVASLVTFGFLCVFSWVIDTQGDTRHRLLVSSIGSVLNVLLSILFVKRIGLAGVALGTLCAYLLTDAWYCPLLVCRRYGVRARAIVAAILRGLGAGLPWALVIWWFARRHAPPGRWVGFFTEAAVVGVLALVYCWFAILTPAERTEWQARLQARN